MLREVDYILGWHLASRGTGVSRGPRRPTSRGCHLMLCRTVPAACRHPTCLLRRFGACLGRMDLGTWLALLCRMDPVHNIRCWCKTAYAKCPNCVSFPALQDYKHEHAVRDLTWDLANASRAREVRLSSTDANGSASRSSLQ